MADILWPTALAPFAASFYLQTHSSVHMSPHTHQMQVLGRSAPRWVCRMSLRGMEAGIGPDLDGFIARLKGPQNRALLFDFRRPVARGNTQSLDSFFADTFGDVVGFSDNTEFTDGTGFLVDFTGALRSDAAIAVGATSFNIVGHTSGATVLKAGDRIGFFGQNRIYSVTQTVVANGIDPATVEFEPPLRVAVADETAIVVDRPRAPFRLLTDDAGANPTDVNGLATYELDFIEDLA